jgi:hypothetical protein
MPYMDRATYAAPLPKMSTPLPQETKKIGVMYSPEHPQNKVSHTAEMHDKHHITMGVLPSGAHQHGVQWAGSYHEGRNHF